MNTSPLQHKNTFADVMGAAVQYRGESPQGQFYFSNGSALITSVFTTLDEAVVRFGSRIDTQNKLMQFSGPYIDGHKTALARRPYAAIRTLGRQAVLEYGLGYIRGILERKPVTVVPPATLPAAVVAATQPAVPSKAILEQIQEEAVEQDVTTPEIEAPAVAPVAPPVPKKRGRPAKVKTEGFEA